MPFLTDQVRKELSRSPYVEKVTESQVIFTAKFKLMAIELNLLGQSPRNIFNHHGINTAYFEDDYPKKTVSRWKKIHERLGDEGLSERRGKNSKGRPKRKPDGTDTKALLARLAYLEAENYILKKLKALAKEQQNSKSSPRRKRYTKE